MSASILLSLLIFLQILDKNVELLFLHHMTLNPFDLKTFFHAVRSGKVTDFNVNTPVLLNGPQIEALEVIENSIFSSIANFSDFEKTKNLTIKNCVFEDDVEMTRCAFLNLTFIGCTFKKSLKLNGINFNDIFFEGGSYHQLMIKNKNASAIQNSITLNGGTFDKVDILGTECLFDLYLSKCKIEFLVVIRANFRGSISIKDNETDIKFFSAQSCTFFDRLDFQNCRPVNILDFHKVTFVEQVVFHDGFNAQSVDFSNVIAKQNVSLNYLGNIWSLRLHNCEFSSTFECDYLGKLPINNENIFNCELTGFIRGNLIFDNISLDEIQLSCSNFGNIIFKEIGTSLIHFENFLNYSKVTFLNIQIIPGKSIFAILDSNIDKTEFINMDFNFFQEIIITRSEISNMILSNSFLPTRIQISSKNWRYTAKHQPGSTISAHTYHRENYRQLKQAMEKQGHRSAALTYKSIEMNHLRREIKWGWDKLLLSMNFVSNKHGASWIRGLLFTLSIAFLLFLFYNVTLTNPISSLDFGATLNETMTAMMKMFSGFVRFLAAFPLFKEQSEHSPGFMSNLVILLSRIFIGYGIYQTIIAFRKFGKD